MNRTHTIPAPVKNSQGDQQQLVRQVLTALGQPALWATVIARSGGDVEVIVTTSSGERCSGRFALLVWASNSEGEPTLASKSMTTGRLITDFTSMGPWVMETADDGVASFNVYSVGAFRVQALVLGPIGQSEVFNV